jgi:hypothetical protein
MENPIRYLTPEQEERGLRLVRRCDAFSLLWDALDFFERNQDETGEDDLENAREELRTLCESAENNLWLFKRKHGIPD